MLLEGCKRGEGVGGMLVLAKPGMVVGGKGDVNEVGCDLCWGVGGAAGEFSHGGGGCRGVGWHIYMCTLSSGLLGLKRCTVLRTCGRFKTSSLVLIFYFAFRLSR